MWLMTTRGFYSVVQHRDDAERLLVRARTREDIEALSDLVAGEPVWLRDADYAWRVEATRDEWQAAMQVLIAEITYPNFKSAVHDAAHEGAYMDVWGILHRLNDDVGPASPLSAP
ncbi:MAG: hypothetical protein ACR2J9_09940 [Gaiellales bacterium]